MKFPLLLLALAIGAGNARAENTAADAAMLGQVRALLAEKCLACHGADPKKIKGEFDLRTRAEALKGGGSGKASVVPGKPGESLLLLAVSWRDKDLQMPPKENDRLTPRQVKLIEQWIADGAAWPDFAAGNTGDLKPGQIQIRTTSGQSTAWSNRGYDAADVWAFLPVKRVDVPKTSGGDAPSAHPIDAFIRARFAEAKLTPAQAADRRTLIRRATFDLTGLPPTARDIEDFLRDDKPDAFERVVDRLLVSPRYGERMAQHWLDVVRYADTGGFSNDYERPHAWRYRDYVIRSFQNDKPFDRFILEQIAGDELDAKNAENLIAVGFLRMGPWEQTAMSVAAITRQMWLDDVTSAVSIAFLGQNLTCCKCHDHKFDPIPTRDYYRFQAAFASTQFAERDALFLAAENTSEFERLRDHAARMHDKAGLKPITAIAPNDDTFNRLQKKREEYGQRAMQRFEAKAFSVTSGNANEVRILRGGMLESPGERVEPGVVSAFVGENTAGADLPSAAAGRRLALAKWIADADHPATARVIVNRVWQMHFGKGLVATPNNFGKTGKRPTHPQLLDHLATWFVENGWSIRKLHRYIMTSATYRQAGEHASLSAVRQVDPNNDLLAWFPPRRLSAEEMRDAALLVTGELSHGSTAAAGDAPRLGGPPVYPEINWEAALQPRHIMGGYAPTYLPSSLPSQRNRRSIYAVRIRTLCDPMLEVFNKPGSEFSCEKRDETTVTPQVFAWFNSEFIHDRALALAVRIAGEAKEPAAQVTAAFQLLHGRNPTDDERKACEHHLAEMTEHHRTAKVEPVPMPTVIRREAIGEQSGQLFRWEEKLNLAGYQRDRKPWEVDAATRGLAELCLVLLNASEFLYVY